MTEFLAVLELFYAILGLLAAAAFGAMLVLVLVGLGWLNIERREP